MTQRPWLLAGALALLGCATGGVSNDDVARLPVADSAQLATARTSIDVARSNLDAARTARAQADQLRNVASGELDATQARLEAARAGVDLGASVRDDRTLGDAWRDEDAARVRMMAARAKLDYANQLVALRDAKVAAARASVTAARADVDVTKLQLVQRNGMAGEVDGRKLAARRQQAQERLAEARARVADMEGSVAQLETAWDARRRQTASRGELMPPPPEAEPAMAPVSPVRNQGRDLLRGDVNDTPSAPERHQSQQPRNNIATPP